MGSPHSLGEHTYLNIELAQCHSEKGVTCKT